MCTQWQNEFELHFRAILGLPVNTALKSRQRRDLRRAGCRGLVFDGVADALCVPNTDIRLFSKPKSFVKRRMGVALAFDPDVKIARQWAKQAAALVKPRVA